MATKQSKRFKAAAAAVAVDQSYSLQDAVVVVKKSATAKFDETVELVLLTCLDPKHADQVLRDVVALPNGTGKTLRVAVFARDDKAKEAEKAGADLVGAEELVASIEKGEINFDRCVATPDMMGLVGKLGKVLGPKGLMPNPKLGTVTTDVAAAVKAIKAGQVEFRAEKAGIVHAGIGKASFSTDALLENIRAYMKAVLQAKPSGAKGNYIQKAVLSSTMGPSVRLDLVDLLAVN